MSSKTAKNVLASNPLDAILGFGSALGGRKGRAIAEGVPRAPARKNDGSRSEEAEPRVDEFPSVPLGEAYELEVVTARRDDAGSTSKEQAVVPQQASAAAESAATELTETVAAEAAASVTGKGLSSAMSVVENRPTSTALESADSKAARDYAAAPANDAVRSSPQPRAAAPQPRQIPVAQDSAVAHRPVIQEQDTAPPTRSAAAQATETTRATQSAVPAAPATRDTSRATSAIASAPSSVVPAAPATRDTAATTRPRVLAPEPKSTPAPAAAAEPAQDVPLQAAAAAPTASSLAFEESSTGTVQAVRQAQQPVEPAIELEAESDDADSLAGRGASFKHRIGTIQEPYIRADGTKVRQWSITLPHDLIRRVSHLALDRGVKPAVLVHQALERMLLEEGD